MENEFNRSIVPGLRQEQTVPDLVKEVNVANAAEIVEIQNLIEQLCDPNVRRQAIAALRTKQFNGLSMCLLSNKAVVPALFEEITSVFDERFCLVSVFGALSILTRLADDPRTRSILIERDIIKHMAAYLKPNHFDPLELSLSAALLLISALVKDSNGDAITYVSVSGIFPPLLAAISRQSEQSKTLATYIFMKIVMNDSGLDLMCSQNDILTEIILALNSYFLETPNATSARLFRQVLLIFQRIHGFHRARTVLRSNFPFYLANGSCFHFIKNDPYAEQIIRSLMADFNAPYPLTVGSGMLPPQLIHPNQIPPMHPSMHPSNMP